MDVLFLSRLQFAFTIMFHYLFPPLTIGLVVVLEGMYLKTKAPQYEMAAKFWTGIFALNFALGVEIVRLLSDHVSFDDGLHTGDDPECNAQF